MVPDQLVYDPASHQGQAAISVMQGSFGFVSGQVEAGGQTQVALLGGPGGGTGQITLSNASGIQPLTQPNTLVSVASAFVPPPPPPPSSPGME
jgi:hypothetical protein